MKVSQTIIANMINFFNCLFVFRIKLINFEMELIFISLNLRVITVFYSFF